MKLNDVMAKLKSLSDPSAVEGMARVGINPEYIIGVTLPALRKTAREIGKDHELAQELWATKIREARLLASMIDDPKMTDEAQMDRWVSDFDSWDVCDGCIMNLFEDTESAWRKAVEWSADEQEFVKRAGFAKKIQEIDSKSAKWIAADALRELTGEPVQKRLSAKN